MESKYTSLTGKLCFTISAAVILLGIATVSFGQNEVTPKAEGVAKASVKKNDIKKVVLPIFSDYKEIRIGMTADEVKDKLGKPKVEDKDGFLYIFSKEEQSQIGLDNDRKVKVIAVIYSDKNGIAPKFKDIFGEEPDRFTQPNGNIYNLVRYPEAGYWVAYSRTVGDDPTVTITMQNMKTRN